MDWSSVATFGSSFIGGLFNNANIDKQIEAQREENERNRQYNLNLARMQNQWNIDQWNRENAYNTPSAQRARLQAAGMNPDLAYGEGVSANVAATSPELTAGAPSSPVDVSNLANKRTVGDLILQGLTAANAKAQLDKTKKDTERTGQDIENMKIEGQILSADALTRAALNEQTIEIGKSQVYLNHSIGKLNHAQVEKVAAEITNLNAQTERVYAERDHLLRLISFMDIKEAQVKFDMFIKSAQFKNECKRLAGELALMGSQVSLNQAKVQDIAATQLARILNLNAQTNLSNAQMNLVDVQTDFSAFNLDQAKDYDSALKVANIASAWMEGIGSIIGSAAGAFIGVRGLNLKSFRFRGKSSGGSTFGD